MTEYPQHLADMVITDDALDLTGRVIERVRFDGCALELRQAMADRTTFTDCIFYECAFIGDGWQWLELEPVSVH